MRKLVKGNEAVVLGSIAAGCDAYFGYPITPASEIAQLTAEYYLKSKKIFLQAECEVSAANMLYGAAGAGLRVMTSSSGPGISLMQETLSFFAGSELPAVFVDITRAGPGIGNIGPEQADYFQVVKGGGHGTYHNIVFAPNSATEMYQMTVKAFELADRYRMPVFLMADATLGQMMEPIDVVELPVVYTPKKWCCDTTPETNGNVLTSIYLSFKEQEEHIQHLDAKFKKVEAEVCEAETYLTDDAEFLLTGYGIVSRILHTVVDRLRSEGMKIGLIRPKTLWPFPTKTFQSVWENGCKICSENGRKICSKSDNEKSNGKSIDEMSDKSNRQLTLPVLVVELSTGQYLEDVRLALPNADIFFYGRTGGNLPSEAEIRNKIVEIIQARR